MTDEVRLIRAEERTEGAPTPGMTREEAIATDRMWSGFVRTEAGMVSGWHHHGSYESSIFVMAGALVMEFGPGGAERLEAGPGDFIYVAPGAVHREGNPDRRRVHHHRDARGRGPARDQRRRPSLSRPSRLRPGRTGAAGSPAVATAQARGAPG